MLAAKTKLAEDYERKEKQAALELKMCVLHPPQCLSATARSCRTAPSPSQQLPTSASPSPLL